jgi:hypothetical protein
MTIGKHYFCIEYSGGFNFSKGSQLVANYIESHLTIAGFSFLKRTAIDRDKNVSTMLGRTTIRGRYGKRS